ncbi:MULTISPECIES: hypothetical protein [unclassified Nocardioides]|uniref:hypothetical protein n=1 Tax=unclassified Nocardioides TaxID=2615069 RepID=UPI0009F0D8F4|nr:MULTISPECIES: hypothetical protein [unclassified Nocardioides]GAW49775.1 Serine/arginine repetitive matrix protein 1 [Nocardioides sp. PD653-B2]GAW56485.1 Serine/arginine repetitive matrix protein 1 [Nocardioides sp. PD653]
MRSYKVKSITIGILAALALTACSGSEEPTSSPPESAPTSGASSDSAATPATPPTSAPGSESGPTLDVTVKGDSVSPNAERIQVDAGETLLVRVESDRAGQLHVHSKPQQFIDFKSGTSTSELVIKIPGIVEIEEHDTSAVVAQVEVQ